MKTSVWPFVSGIEDKTSMSKMALELIGESQKLLLYEFMLQGRMKNHFFK